MNGNIIYAYKKKNNQKIVYVGQTVNLPHRHKQHIKWDPFNKNNREYNYPLSRGIRKYGVDEYELIILESNISQSDLNKREKYWIDYYDTYFKGYNQTIGGNNPTQSIFTKDTVNNVIDMLKDESYSYAEIQNKTGVSMAHICNINKGERRKQDSLDYPIRSTNTKGMKGIKFSLEECKQIHTIILNTNMTYKEIAKKLQCGDDLIRKINRGLTKAYHLDGYSYPLRKNKKGK